MERIEALICLSTLGPVLYAIGSLITSLATVTALAMPAQGTTSLTDKQAGYSQAAYDECMDQTDTTLSECSDLN